MGERVNRIIGQYRRMVTSKAQPLTPLPSVGRAYSQVRKVRLGDVRPDGKLRFDALVRYAQDVSNDDTTDAELVNDLAWVVRKTTVDVVVEAEFGEVLTFVTFCSGLGGRWAERRLHVTGDRGARIEVATLWVHLDPDSGRPSRLSQQFIDLYAEAAQGRKVGARLDHPDPGPSATTRSWPIRYVDFDIFDHMNNAAYWAAVEELIAERSFPPVRCRAELEYGHGIDHGGDITLIVDDVAVGPATSSSRGFALWWSSDEAAKPAASGLVFSLPDDWYR
ncbi:MAG: thioesterase [Acidimicrobiales bacterium]